MCYCSVSASVISLLLSGKGELKMYFFFSIPIYDYKPQVKTSCWRWMAPAGSLRGTYFPGVGMPQASSLKPFPPPTGVPGSVEVYKGDCSELMTQPDALSHTCGHMQSYHFVPTGWGRSERTMSCLGNSSVLKSLSHLSLEGSIHIYSVPPFFFTLFP